MVDIEQWKEGWPHDTHENYPWHSWTAELLKLVFQHTCLDVAIFRSTRVISALYSKKHTQVYNPAIEGKSNIFLEVCTQEFGTSSNSVDPPPSLIDANGFPIVTQTSLVILIPLSSLAAELGTIMGQGKTRHNYYVKRLNSKLCALHKHKKTSRQPSKPAYNNTIPAPLIWRTASSKWEVNYLLFIRRNSTHLAF